LAFNYFSEKEQFKFRNKRATSNWLKNVIQSHSKVPGQINFIFCSDEQLLEINQTYLKHFYLTDVITFNYNINHFISGDIYISVDRISENALKFYVTFDVELRRVMVHGILHLIGFKDKTLADKKQMRNLENFYLNENREK
jgi:rRNA maturation RNase YbeY